MKWETVKHFSLIKIQCHEKGYLYRIYQNFDGKFELLITSPTNFAEAERVEVDTLEEAKQIAEEHAENQ